MDNILDKVTINEVTNIYKQYSKDHRMSLTINYDDIHKVVEESEYYIYISITDKNIDKTFYARLRFRSEDSDLTLSLFKKLEQNISDYVKHTNNQNFQIGEEITQEEFRGLLIKLGIMIDEKITFSLSGIYHDLERDFLKDQKTILPFESEDYELYQSYLYNLETVLRTKLISCS